jgi:hypothetical protein
VPAESRCTPEVIDAICAHLGNPDRPRALRAALRRAGVSKSAYYDWARRAEAGEEPYATAIARIEAARDVLRDKIADEIRSIAARATKDDATRLNALKWLLEKLGGDDWNPPAKSEISGPGGGAIPLAATVDLRWPDEPRELSPDDGAPPAAAPAAG